MKDWTIVALVVLIVALGTLQITMALGCRERGGVYLYREGACLTPELLHGRG